MFNLNEYQQFDYSICCFSNNVTIEKIDDETISDMENFVREDLFELLSTECDIDDQTPLKNFYGLYHANKNKFRFMPGEKVLLKRIAEHVEKINTDEKKIEQFKPPNKYKISRKDTCRLFGATFYGKRSYEKKNRNELDDIVLDSEQQLDDRTPPEKLSLRSKLFRITKEKYESKYPSLAGNVFLTENMVKIIKNGNRIVGTVQCVFCASEKKSKSITIQYDDKNDGSYYWNFSNLFKHLKKHSSEGDADMNIDEVLNEDDNREMYTNYEVLENAIQNGEMDTKEWGESIVDGNIEELDVIVIENNELNSSSETIAECKSTSCSDEEIVSSNSNDGTPFVIDLDINSNEFLLFEQISSQNLILTKAIYSHNERKKAMNFTLNGLEAKVDVIKINGDGSCLFGSLAHQLFQHKVNSNNHKKAAKALRVDVVKYINSNVNEFLYEIAGRIQDEEERRLGYVQTKTSDITEEKCCAFLNTSLVKQSFFGGSETMKAITLMHKVNILCFNESGPVYFPLGFNSNHHKTVFLAYRLKPDSKDVRNHYESVAEVDAKILFEVVKAVNQCETMKGINRLDEDVMEIN